MTRAIEYLKKTSEKSSRHRLPLRKFLVAILYALTFAPDRESSGSFRSLRKKFEEYFGYATKVEEGLEKEFFSWLYIDRKERKEIEEMIPAMRLILVHGLIGTGKSVVLKKIKDEFDRRGIFKMIYFDSKATTEIFEKTKNENFPEKFRKYIFNRLSEEYIHKSKTLIKEWHIYKIQFDEQDEYADFRRWVIEDFAKHPIENKSEWQDMLEKKAVQERYNSLKSAPQLKTLLKFLKDNFPFVLCFDNVDRYPIIRQRQMLSISIDISNELQIPIILAIREHNLKRLSKEGDRADPILMDYLERLKAGEEKEVWVEDMPDVSIKKLLENRFTFIEHFKGFSTVTDFFKQLEREHKLDICDYKKRFWETFYLISKTFIDKGIYRYCNYNIREILTLYFRFVSTILLDPEEGYRIDELLLYEKSLRITRLRNYFYKWLICAGSLIPKTKEGLLNIYRHCVPNLRMLDLRILEFIYNWEKRNPESNLYFSMMASEFKRFGVKEEILKKHILDLTKIQGFYELNFIWLDQDENAPITKDTIIELMPTGKYFLEVISISREYAFWNALRTNLRIDIVGRRFTLPETYIDEFKLEVVYKFARQILFPAFKEEIEYFDSNLQTPRYWDGSNLEYFKNIFSINSHFYLYRLLVSVIHSIPFAKISSDKKKIYRHKYNQLLKETEKREGIT